MLLLVVLLLLLTERLEEMTTVSPANPATYRLPGHG
jgi:hypothetical protein